MKILFIIFSYLFGSIPTGYIFYKLSEKKDIRSFGSHSTGATNVLRLKGIKTAILVLIIDFLKGILPAFLASELFDDMRFSLLCGFFTILGHCFPVYIKFRGGKGVATTMGIFAFLAFKPFLLCLVVFLLVVLLTRFVSLGSMLSILSYPIFVYILNGKFEIILLSSIIFFLIASRHWNNIKRLARGKENKI